MKIFYAHDNFYLPDMPKKLTPYIDGIKVGTRWLYLNGSPGLLKIKRETEGLPIFLDLKLYDTTKTISDLVDFLSPMDWNYLTISSRCGIECIKKANDIVTKRNKKLLIVYHLTSLEDWDVSDEITDHRITWDEYVINELYTSTNIYGLISPLDCNRSNKNYFPEFKLFTPGIIINKLNEGQHMVATPERAKQTGADAIIVGRAISNAENPIDMAKLIRSSINDN